ncbi:MAG: FtsX-like permease family protein [Bacteroidota bacterium]
MNTHHQPPRWADHFLKWFCAEELLEEIQGDLYEAYQHRLREKGKGYAMRCYISDVFAFFQPYAFEKYSRTKQYLPMFDNYFKITLRNIIHRKGFTAINYLGLTIGVVAVLLIALYLRNEWTYDHSVPEHDRIFRLMNQYRDQTYSNMSFNDFYGSSPETQLLLTQHLRGYEEVIEACHFVPSQSAIGGNDQYFVEIEKDRFVAENVLYTNTGDAFQAIFPQKYLMGTAENAFSTYDKIVLTEKLASRWFGADWQKQELIGQNLLIREENYELAGIIENMPSNTHFELDFIVHQKEIPSWGAYTYLKLNPTAEIEPILQRFNDEIDKVYPGYWEDELSKGVIAVALDDIHFSQGNLYELKPTANRTYLHTFAFVACIILFIIWINYTNLSVAMYADRQKELGMRKVLGARAQDISAQLLLEAIFLALICLPGCWLLLRLLLPYFNELMQISIPIATLWHWTMFLSLFGLLFLTGLLSGLYPALVYGKRPSLQLFKNKTKWTVGNRFFNFRNVLVTGQFIVIIALLSLTYFAYQQMNFVAQKDLGFQKEGIIYFPVDGAEKFNQMKTKLLALPEVEAVGANAVPGAEMANQLTYKMADTEVTFSDGSLEYFDLGNVKTLGLNCEACQQLEEGKERIFVVNRTAAKKLAKTKNVSVEELIGETVVTEPEYQNEDQSFGFPYVIDGIIDDYNYHSLKIASQPMLIEIHKNIPWVYYALLRANTNNWASTLQDIKTVYTEVESVRPFDFTFLEEHLNELYVAERRMGVLLASLSLIALVLAFMGLAGVVSYLAYSKQKEIGIRKVLGASVSGILFHFNKEFLLLIGLATVISLPIAIYFAHQWLNNFAYRIQPQAWVVLLAAALAALLVVVLVSLQSRKAAINPPMEVLRLE